ncbi:mucin-5AC-like [Macrobrachium nipponense]|uniref:mucin-5AC-like n=1 Tax=Macrobrachium nipponense TaxID=159736 RepID=UPI0030C84E86
MGGTPSPRLVLWCITVAISSRPTSGASTVVWYPAMVGASSLFNSILDLPVGNELSCAMKATKMANFNLWCYVNETCSLYDMDVLPFTDHSGTDIIVHCMTKIPMNPIGNSSSFPDSDSSSTIFSTATSAVTSPISSSAVIETTSTQASTSSSTTASTTTTLTTSTTTTLPETTTESTITTTTFTTAIPDTSTTTTTVTTSTTTPTTSTTSTTTTALTTTSATAGTIEGLCTNVNQLGCIYLVDVMATWYDAKVGCEDLGGHLYNAETEQQFLDLVSYVRSNGYPRYVWIGVKSRNWTLTSRPVSDNEWSFSEPNGPLEYCGYMNREMDYYLADFVCNDPSPYLCQS